MHLFLRNRSIAELTDAERDGLEQAISERRHVPARVTLVDRGQRLRYSTMLISGFMIRYIDDLDGHRQVVAFHVPGDFVDLHGYPLQVLDHAVATLTEVEIALVPHDALKRLTEGDAEFARKLWASTLLDAAIHREWLFRLGRLGAVGRVAHFFAETNARLCAIGLSDGTAYDLRITQNDLSEITGLTSIHVNRVLRMLREEGICVFRGSRVDILDRSRLERLGQFDPAYLYLKDPLTPFEPMPTTRKEHADE
ncbi:Crp/Fnr family transcriptional regulator [Sphingomonas nostoxanthinifaciens]|nr:Crp/Fnr family transcriptional regulator [Sphingomonas nostoxanthinifaciens]